MGREANRWGNCVVCGGMLLPEDAQPYSDLCLFCTLIDYTLDVARQRASYCAKMQKQDEMTPAGIEHWKTKESYYKDMAERIREIYRLRKHHPQYPGVDHDNCYPDPRISEEIYTVFRRAYDARQKEIEEEAEAK